MIIPQPVAVTEAEAIIAPINALIRRFDHVAATQDWHPRGHVSFASANAACETRSTVFLGGCSQVLHPEHCVAGSRGAQFHPRLRTASFEFILRTGFRASMDSHSAFFDQDGVTPTGLAGYLEDRAIRRLFCVGLPLDSAVRFTAEDAARMDFEAVVLTDACRATSGGVALADAMSMMARAGVMFATCADIGERPAAVC